MSLQASLQHRKHCVVCSVALSFPEKSVSTISIANPRAKKGQQLILPAALMMIYIVPAIISPRA